MNTPSCWYMSFWKSSHLCLLNCSFYAAILMGGRRKAQPEDRLEWWEASLFGAVPYLTSDSSFGSWSRHHQISCGRFINISAAKVRDPYMPAMSGLSSCSYARVSFLWWFMSRFWGSHSLVITRIGRGGLALCLMCRLVLGFDHLFPGHPWHWTMVLASSWCTGVCITFFYFGGDGKIWYRLSVRS